MSVAMELKKAIGHAKRGLSMNAIARRLSVSRSTVMSRLYDTAGWPYQFKVFERKTRFSGGYVRALRKQGLTWARIGKKCHIHASTAVYYARYKT